MDAPQFTGKGCTHRKLTDDDRAEIVRLYITPLPDGTWMGASTIARRFNVRHPVIYRELQRAGVPTRSMSEAHRGKACRPVKNLPVGVPPKCKCGCGQLTPWHQRRNRWAAYVPGHQHRPKPYHDATWLYEQYVTRRQTADEIARLVGVHGGTIIKALIAAGIPRRDRSESRIGRMVGDRNPAWKGGVAEWGYASGWKAIATKIRKRDKWTCQDCGEFHKGWGDTLHVHHIDGDKYNNDDANLVSLCAGCHYNRHRKGGDA